MKLLQKPFSRLSLIFLLAIIMPGIILTYFGTLHIKNLKELTEKSVLEEEKDIIESITGTIQAELNNITQIIDGNFAKDDIIRQSTKEIVDSLKYISNYFVLDKENKFIIPNYIDPVSNSSGNNNSSIKLLFQSAEKVEFRDKNFSQAEKSYLELIPIVSNQSDSAKVINALARVLFKSKKHAQAIKQYQKLINFAHVLDTNGFPYINYAVSQLTELLIQTNNPSIFETIELVIINMASGEIPITYNTDTLLDKISDWMFSQDSLNINNRSSVEYNINKIKEQISFIESLKTNISNLDGSINNYYPVPTIDGDHLLIIKKQNIKDDNKIGFLVDLETLKAQKIDEVLQTNMDFDYIIAFQDQEPNPTNMAGELISYSKLFSFPSNEIVIVKLANPSILDSNVLRAVWIFGSALVLLFGAMIFGVILIFRDITREHHMSQLRSDFVSGVTHELKTPLTSIHMFAESMFMNRINKVQERKEYLQIIMHETSRLKRLINNILDFSKLENDKLQLNIREVNLSSLIENILQEMEYWIQSENFTISKQIQKYIFVKVDADAITQAVINLISNAIRHSRDSREINLRVNQDKNNIQIEVEDKGIGISENQLQKIFTKFYRVDIDSTGTGLGLYVTKQIVEDHGGLITVKSVLDQGSIFTIKLNK